ncbi:ribonuclease P protein subunit p30 [Fopius arisanus]|uniref:Ribonuclease P protein subunit p30 n=1 Tax=Fopius arisanus TaxID=64838 RepID=A0A9R1SY73_9HYME|nr:PREDICTED: ribonuclease P protein subunit p30 [Fopius arisanus]
MSYNGFYDLCINFNGENKEKLPRLLSRLHEMGYRTIAINQSLDESALEVVKKKKKKGESADTNDPLAAVINPVDIEALRDQFKDKLCILSRLTFTFTDTAKTYTLCQAASFKKFHLFAVMPKNQAALQFACSQLNVDIVTINSSNSSFKFTRKLYLQAVDRGVHFEVRYADVIDRTTRKMAIQYSHLFHVYGKSKNVILSSGTADYTMVRNPYDIITLGALFGLSEVKAKAAVSGQCHHLILKAEGRRFGKAVFGIETTGAASASDEDDTDDDEPETEIPPNPKKVKV